MKLDRWKSNHPVANAIATGSYWFSAWVEQKATPEAVLAKQTGIAAARLMAIDAGDAVSRAELAALARAWSVSTGDLIASMDGATKVVD